MKFASAVETGDIADSGFFQAGTGNSAGSFAEALSPSAIEQKFFASSRFVNHAQVGVHAAILGINVDDGISYLEDVSVPVLTRLVIIVVFNGAAAALIRGVDKSKFFYVVPPFPEDHGQRLFLKAGLHIMRTYV